MSSDADRREMQALRELFRELMKREAETPPFDSDARVRVGETIERATRHRGSPYSYTKLRPSQ